MLGVGPRLSGVLTRGGVSFRGVLFNGYMAAKTPSRLITARNLCLSQRHRKARSPQEEDEEEEEVPEPIKFSTSRASHRVWSVDRGLGSTHERPWWKVLPLSVFGVCFLLWCVFRPASQVDEKLEKQLEDHIRGIGSGEDDEEEDEEEDETKPDS